MARAVPISLLLHGVALAALSLWLAGHLELPATDALPPINLRLRPIEDSNRAERERDAASGLQAPTELAAPDAVTASAPAPSAASAATGLAPAHGGTPSQAADPTPIPEQSDPGTLESSQVPRPSVAEQALSVAPAELTVAVSRAPWSAADFAAAAPPTEPLSTDQARMLRKRLERWSADLDRLTEPDSSVVWTRDAQQYRATFKRVPAPDDTGLEQVLVEISTEQNGSKLSTELRMRRLAFSNFAQLVDRWDPSVQIHDDELDGRFHSNTEISVLYDRRVAPKFYGKVTTASRRINTSNSKGRPKRKAIFQGGLETGVRKIPLPTPVPPFLPQDEPDRAQITYFDTDTRIDFLSDGRFSWRPTASPTDERMEVISEESHYLVAGRKVKLFLKGTVRGKVLVYSPERIVIEGNLVYADYPTITPESGNYLGLVSDKYVEIAPPEVTGPGDLLINAAIYAKRRFIVRRYRARENAMLLLYGSLTAGSLSATEPRYYTRIRFDQRLQALRPPSFPMSDRYELESWNPRWTAATPGD